jgi:cell wall-associated NlpC family hydrolase
LIDEQNQSEQPVKQRKLARSDAVAIARTFLGTKYVLGGRVKGAGADCATLLSMYLEEIGACNKEDFADVGIYTHDWFQHASSDRYLLRLMRHAPKVLDTVCLGIVAAKPGSLALFRVVGSKLFNHGGIITQWPRMIHAVYPRVTESIASTHWLTAHREMKIFDPWSNE